MQRIHSRKNSNAWKVWNCITMKTPKREWKESEWLWKREREREREREMECVCAKPSMTRFGAILPLRQYFLKPHSILSVYLVFGTILNLLWQIVYVIRPIFTVANGQILNIWSHWCKAECERTLNYLMAESGDGKVKEWFVGDFLQQTKTLD